ncbi:MAG: hypothetical protein VCA36_12290, partial [Opitutales bacterium]
DALPISDLPEEEWQNEITRLQEKKNVLTGQITEKQRVLDRFGVEKEDFLPGDPGVEWDSEEQEKISAQLRTKQGNREEAQGEEGKLKQKIGNAIGELNDSWEFLIGELEKKLNKKTKSYKKVTAELLAKICVDSAAKRLQDEEDKVIRQNLGAPEIGKTLKQVTNGHYSAFDWQSGKLYLRSKENELRDIEFLATGAREQAMIALRMVFAPRFLGGVPAFLILDDAFQHADWVRRKALVKHTIRLVKDLGWQVFYFTMDDQLRDLFQGRAEKVLPDDFQYLELSPSPDS